MRDMVEVEESGGGCSDGTSFREGEKGHCHERYDGEERHELRHLPGLELCDVKMNGREAWRVL